MKLITIHQTSHWKTATATRPTEKQMISPASWFYYGKEEFEDICLEFLTLTHPEFKAYLNLVRCGFCPGQGRMEPLLIILRYVRVSWTGPNSSCRGLGEGRSWVYMNLLLSSFSSTLKGNSWVVQLCDQDASWVPLAYDEDPCWRDYFCSSKLKSKNQQKSFLFRNTRVCRDVKSLWGQIRDRNGPWTKRELDAFRDVDPEDMTMVAALESAKKRFSSPTSLLYLWNVTCRRDEITLPVTSFFFATRHVNAVPLRGAQWKPRWWSHVSNARHGDWELLSVMEWRTPPQTHLGNLMGAPVYHVMLSVQEEEAHCVHSSLAAFVKTEMCVEANGPREINESIKQKNPVSTQAWRILWLW